MTTSFLIWPSVQTLFPFSFLCFVFICTTLFCWGYGRNGLALVLWHLAVAFEAIKLSDREVWGLIHGQVTARCFFFFLSKRNLKVFPSVLTLWNKIPNVILSHRASSYRMQSCHVQVTDFLHSCVVVWGRKISAPSRPEMIAVGNWQCRTW